MLKIKSQKLSLIILIFVDSITYQEILHSKVIHSRFAFSQEKKQIGYKGIYVLGRDNYIEIFNPNSVENEYNEAGVSWICYTSMKANHLKELVSKSENNFDLLSDDDFDDLSLYFHDSTNLLTTLEMKKNHYESWSKKIYNDTVSFHSIDYNSPDDSDSTKNYLFKNILGIKVLVNFADSVNFVNYMNFIGYRMTQEVGKSLHFSNSIDFIEVDFHSKIKFPTITTVFMDLNQECEKEKLKIGKSLLIIEKNRAIWEFNTTLKL